MTAATDVFISYASADRDVTRRFAEAFEAEGFSVWWDSALRSGDAYDQRIEMALRQARAVVVLWSKTSVESRWVRAEATLADRNRTLAPCLIEPCERPIMFELTHTADLSHWKGARTDATWRAFVADIRRIIETERAPEQAAPTTPPPTVKETTKAGDKIGAAPSLAVLPFNNRSMLEEDEVFAEGMVEDVISALSQGVNIRVLGSTATAAFHKGVITDLAAVGRQLGVRYLLEGNVRRVGANLRVTTQLLEAETGEVLWSQRFDRPLNELATLQENLVLEVAAHLDAQVHTIEMERALRKPGDVTAWEATFRSYGAVRQRIDPGTLQMAVEEAQRAVEIAPDFAPAHGLLAWALAIAHFFSNPDDEEETKSIRRVCDRAMALGAFDPIVQTPVAEAYCFIGLPDQAYAISSMAVRKAPGHGWAHFAHALSSSMLNRIEEAMAALATAERLMPGPAWLFLILAWRSIVFVRTDRWEEAQAALDECVAVNPGLILAWKLKAVVSWRLGKEAEARQIHKRLASEGGWGDQTQGTFRHTFVNSPNLDEILQMVRALEAQT